MKKSTLVLITFAGVIAVLLIHAQSDPLHLTDSTGSLFVPTNLHQRLNTLDAATVRGGSQIVTALETTKLIAFNRPMPDASYIVLATPSLATSVSIAGKTTNGFTLNLTVGIAGRVDWLAINPQ